MLPNDPITLIGQTIVRLLQNCPAINALGMDVQFESPEGDQTQFGSWKPDIQTSDLPEICVVQGKFGFPTGKFTPQNSGADFAHQSYIITPVIDGMQTPPLNQIKVAVNSALKLANQGGLNLGLPGFVYKYDTRDCGDRCFGGKEWTRSTTRWWATMAIDVTYYIFQNDLLNIWSGAYTNIPTAPA
jgi:hypothetical protein